MSSIKAQSTPFIALFGGTFDPIHLGHIIPAKETVQWLGAEQLLLIPSHIPPHKFVTQADAEHRANMVSLACESSATFSFDGRELNRNGHSYTVDTLQELSAEHPDAMLFFIMGMDSLLSFTQWYQWQKILTLCNLVVNIRPGYDHKTLESTLEPTLRERLIYDLKQIQHKQHGQILIHESSPIDISSTDIREKIKAGLNYKAYLPEKVYQYIKKNNLYR